MKIKFEIPNIGGPFSIKDYNDYQKQNNANCPTYLKKFDLTKYNLSDDSKIICHQRVDEGGHFVGIHVLK